MERIIRPAALQDLPFLADHDRHVTPAELDGIIRRGRILILEVDGVPAGWLRWNLFWDNTPFMNMLYLLDGYRMQGHGRALVCCWEESLRALGYAVAMTSTQANEGAQHFYRHMNYRDIGGFLQEGEPYELILQKTL